MAQHYECTVQAKTTKNYYSKARRKVDKYVKNGLKKEKYWNNSVLKKVSKDNRKWFRGKNRND